MVLAIRHPGNTRPVKLSEISDWNASGYDLLRMDAIMRRMDSLFFECGQLNFRKLPAYFMSIEALDRYVSRHMHQETKDKFDEDFRIIEHDIFYRAQFTWGTFRRLRVLHSNLLYVMQKMGLGTLTHKFDDTLKRVLRPEYGGEQDVSGAEARSEG